MRLWQEARYIVGKLNRHRSEHDLDDELRAHVEIEIDEKVRDGMSPEEARYSALRAFGSVALSKEHSRSTWGLRSADQMIQDLRFAARLLLKQPGFAAVSILAIAIG